MAVPRNQTIDPFADPAGASAMADDFEVDLSAAESNFRIPAGAYEGKLINLERDVSQAGNPMWTWTWQVVSGPAAGRTFKNFTAITPQALWKLAETIEALGLGVQGSVASFKLSQALNKLATLNIIDDSYNGTERSTIGSVSAHPDGAGTKSKASGQP